MTLALAACATPPPAPAPQPQPAPAPPPVAAPPPPADTCGVEAVKHLVGRPRTEIPVPLRPELQRVACTTCPVTLDFNQNRLNFFFDAETGLIKEIKCG
jgi:hypothetical protein